MTMTSEQLAVRLSAVDDKMADARRVANLCGQDQRPIVDALAALTSAVQIVAELLLPHPDEFVRPEPCEMTCTADPCRHDIASGYASPS